MSAALSITPASGSIVNRKSACRINLTGASISDITTYNAAHVPSEDAMHYRIVAHQTGWTNDLISEKFVPSAVGKYEWNNVIFPAAGTWTVRLVDQGDASIDATLSVVVS